jgi:hypothetical protein
MISLHKYADNTDEQNNPDFGQASEADKSALGAINRPLRVAGLFCSSALSIGELTEMIMRDYRVSHSIRT